MIFITYPPIWTQEVVDKIWQKHRATVEEVEEAIFSDHPKSIKGQSGSDWLFGYAISGRLLFIVLRKKRGIGRYKVITAREMTEKEKRYYRQAR